MGIMAVLGTIGVSALISSRNNSLVDATTEELTATIRLAQNNTISIKEGVCNPSAPNATTKAWGVSITATNFTLDYYCNDTASGLVKHAGATLSPYPRMTFSPSAYVYFSTPFGKGYNLATAAANSSWSQRPTAQKDWTPNGSSASGNITISSGAYSRTITVEANGDVYAN